MTISNEITRIKNNIASAYTILSDRGATLPTTQDSANLASCINSIQNTFAISNLNISNAMRIENGVIYKNTGASYIDTNYSVTFTPEQWKKELIIQVHIKTPSSFNNHGHWILGSSSGEWNTGIGLTINKDAGYTFWFMLGQSEKTLSVSFSGTTVPQLDKEYWVRIYKPNTEFFETQTLFQISTDGINWTTEASQTIANISSNYTTTGCFRLMNGLWGDSNNQFDGGLYFDDDTYISVDGEKIWCLIN